MRHGSDLGIGHEVARTQDLSEPSDNRHHVRVSRCTGRIRSSRPGWSPSGPRPPRCPHRPRLASSAFSRHVRRPRRECSLPVPLGRLDHASDHLVRMARVDPEVHQRSRRFHRTSRSHWLLISATASARLTGRRSPTNASTAAAHARLPSFRHRAYPLISIPMERAPNLSTICIAASTSYAFRSFHLRLGDFANLLCVSR